MARSVKLDLRGAPPVSGGMRDHIPPGRYRIRVLKVEDTTSKSGKRMFAASYKVSAGENIGANLGDNFTLVDNTGQPSKMGLGRLHHFLLCLGLPVKEAVVNLDLDRLSDLELEAEVVDETFESGGQSRLTSAIRGYSSITKANTNGLATPAAIEAAPSEGESLVAQSVPPTAEAPTEEEEAVEAELTTVVDETEDLFR